MNYPVTVDKEKLIVTMTKSRFTGEDCEIFRMYGFIWSPDGSVNIPVRGTSKKALWSTIKVLYPNIQQWIGYKEMIDNIKEAYKIFEQGFDDAVSDKFPIYSNLYEHQKECVRVQCYKKNNMLSLEQGLGKSISSIIPSFILKTPLTLIIVPNSLKYNWMEEMSVTWQDRFGYGVPRNQISVIDARKGYMKAEDEKYIIINYDIVGSYFDFLVERCTDKTRVIIDECHYIKNRDAKRTKYIKSLINKIRPYVSFLSGTPAPNTIVDIFSYLEIARHYEGQNYKYFMKKYCVISKTAYGFKVTDTHNLEELQRNVQNFMIRKLKKDCLNLPEKNFIKINLENDKYDAMYAMAYKALMEKIMQSGGKRSADIESQMNTLQIITAKAKVEGIIELAENIMSEVTEREEIITQRVDFPGGYKTEHIRTGKIITYPKKVAIACNFKEPLKMLYEHFGSKCVMIDGSVPSEKRMDLVNSFRKMDDVQVFLGQTTAAGVGLNMIECQDAIFMNFPYTRAEIDQFSDRFHRIGTFGSVNVYFSVLVGKIDEYLYKLVQKKYRSVSKLMDGKVDNTETVDVGDDFVGDLFSQMRDEILNKQLV